MARSRNIKPGFYKNPELVECSVWARLIFPGLWMLADREGRLPDRPKQIKMELLPADEQDVEPLLRELEAHGFLVRYRNSDGSFIQISNFEKHQSPHFSEKASVIKPPDSEKSGVIKPPDSEKDVSLKATDSESTPGNDVPSSGPGGAIPPENSEKDAPLRGGRNPLIPDCLIPDSLNPLKTPSSAEPTGPGVADGPDKGRPTTGAETRDAPPVTRDADPGGRPTIPCPYREIVAAYHAQLPSLPRVRLQDGPTWAARQKAMRSVWGWVLSSSRSDGTPRATTGEEGLRWVTDYFARASKNDFVMGRTPRSPEHVNWRADFDFLLTQKGLKQVIEKTQGVAA